MDPDSEKIDPSSRSISAMNKTTPKSGIVFKHGKITDQENKVVNYLLCPECGESVKNKYCGIKHMKTQHKINYYCQNCEVFYRTNGEFIEHKQATECGKPPKQENNTQCKTEIKGGEMDKSCSSDGHIDMNEFLEKCTDDNGHL